MTTPEKNLPISAGVPASDNWSLANAKKAKQDEFYTRLEDISNELKHFKAQLRGKTILCNCDDPFESNFFKYFALNFKTLAVKKLIVTSYKRSPIVGRQLPLLTIEGLKPDGKEPYVLEINEIPDRNGDGAIDLADVKFLLTHNANTARVLKDDETYSGGDFRSKECVNILEQVDIVITNPPFSLFREYVSQLIDNKKKFLVVGSKNAVTYKDVFILIKDDKMWLGHGFVAGNAYFKIPPENAREFASGVYDEATGLVKFRNVSWFTNMDYESRHEPLPLFKKYVSTEYPKYSNYDAIEVGKIADIPMDYPGNMGVPITFLDRYNPEQFVIVGSSRDLGVPISTIAAKGTYVQGGPRFYLPNADGSHRRMYDRFVVKNKNA